MTRIVRDGAVLHAVGGLTVVSPTACTGEHRGAARWLLRSDYEAHAPETCSTALSRWSSSTGAITRAAVRHRLAGERNAQGSSPRARFAAPVEIGEERLHERVM